MFGTRFRTGRPELGYSAHLEGCRLVLETVSKGRRSQTHTVDFPFQSYCWYMVTVCYVHNRIRSSQLSCLVDGQLRLTADVTLPATDDVRMMYHMEENFKGQRSS